ncbi:MAG TPA: NAD(P)-dependent oxidoreductase [Methylophilus sp.]|uniref:NAD-dependent epimerase/dehydratase family protein n=1 Tax=Methylophilus sp. TaxID=29541 RepID=UPI002B8B6DD6|nr:NAD(P)-dependent oxidoreductase [Methylophilus sp.]HSH88039.1 NAD(P)-dependent oxidoreductase [Methylophilus sp.]
MKVLILGATGHVGSRLHNQLQQHNITSIAASRGRMRSDLSNHVILDSMNLSDLTKQLQNVDAVVNCVAGSKDSIGTGAQILTQAALAAGKPLIVHLSTMSVYGASEGVINETSPFDPDYNWYAAAKVEAENHMQAYAHAGGKVVVFRPGCIHGPGSTQWVERISNLLGNFRLGDLGDAGDGWSNLVHVDDVVNAIQLGINLPLREGEIQHYNLAAPDSPRWNQYFIDLGQAIDATPVKRIHPTQLKLDSKAFSPCVKIGQKLLEKVGKANLARHLPEPLPPSLVRLFKQHIFLDVQKISSIGFTFTPYQESLCDCVAWFKHEQH